MIIHVVASIDAAEGGVPRSTVALARHVAEKHSQHLVVLQVEGEHRQELTDASKPFFHTAASTRFKTDGVARQLDLLHSASRIDVVHDNGLWLPMHHGIAAWCRRRQVRRVVSVRGMLNPWARSHHAARKRLAWVAFQRSDLATADVLHATSHDELAAIREVGMRQPVIVLPNGIDPPPDMPTKTPAPSGLRTALFLSRLHPSKGLDLLLQAWRDAAPGGWQLLIAGAGTTAFERSIEDAIFALGLRDTVSLCGPADDVGKWSLYSQADLFLLPTRSENFGLVVAEALVAGVPVITTYAAPWDWLPERQAGWWVPVDAASLSTAIRAATMRSPDELRAMGKRGRIEALQRFTWSAVAPQFAAAYDWLLGCGPAPACVHF